MEKTSFVTPVLCVAAGHSGGHILPARTLAYEWQAKNPNSECIFFSTTKQLDKKILESSKEFKIIHLKMHGLSVKKSWQLPLRIFEFIQSFIRSYKILGKQPVAKVITTGGYVAIPVCIAAKILRIPIELYELNAVPGKAVRLLSYVAQTTYVCFPTAQQYFKNKNCIVSNYPLRQDVRKQALPQQKAQDSLGLEPNRTTLLILGGSQGSMFINTVIKKWLNTKAYNDIQIIHQTGSHDTTDWAHLYKTHNIPAKVFQYHENMHQLYCASDIVLCRSGAGSLFEVIHYKKKCITIPLTLQAGNHQVINALALQKLYPELIHILEQNAVTDDVTKFTTMLETLLDQ